MYLAQMWPKQTINAADDLAVRACHFLCNRSNYERPCREVPGLSAGLGANYLKAVLLR